MESADAEILAGIQTRQADVAVVLQDAYVGVAGTDGANVDYSRFFERFYRGDTSHNSQKAGYGIGLSMAEELTKLMGGKINVSYKAQRITFTVRLG